jgi:hypothetical protein
MLRTVRLLPPTGHLTLGFDIGRFPPTPPACYRASWQLPGPDFHRQATANLRLMINPLHSIDLQSPGRTEQHV